MNDAALIERMMLIRSFEERLAGLPGAGFQLFSTGEEAVAVGVCAALQSQDQLLTSGRSIGWSLARGIEPGALLAELLGKRAGPCRGRAGRGHVSYPSRGFFGAHAVVAGNLSVAAGVALAEQEQARGAITVVVFGDGACGAGSLHETLNIAALWKLPLVFVCNNNQYSVSTPVTRAIAVSRLSDLARPFGVRAETVDGMDLATVLSAAKRAVAHARSGEGPAFLECVSYRFCSHSSLSRESRPRDEIARWRERCPIERLAARLSADDAAALRSSVARIVDEACAFALAAPSPAPEESLGGLHPDDLAATPP